MMLRNKLILLLGEALIPLLGFYLWNWNLYFIFLFMFLDLIAYCVVYPFKIRKICSFKENKLVFSKLIFQILFILGMVSVIFYTYTGFFNTLQQTFFEREIIRFFVYEDMGFAQGYILLPLIALTAWSSYKSEFIILGGFAHTSTKQLFKNYTVDLALSLALFALFMVFYQLGFRSQTFYFYVGMVLFLSYKAISILRIKETQ